MKRILVLSIVLALVLSLALPSVAMAKPPEKEFCATGIMTEIDEGNVKPLGDSGLWLVKDRHIGGSFINGDLGTSSFTITYGGVFEIVTQAGHMQGEMEVDEMTFKINGDVEPLEMFYVSEIDTYLPMLTINGNWNGHRGVNGNGSFSAYMVFVPTADGHVDYIVSSAFVMEGKCKFK